jgi:hypothetical protein
MTLVEACEPELVRKCISKGCKVDHQDGIGRRALHVCAEVVWSHFFSTSRNDRSLNILNCAEAIVSNGANPFLGDYCRCVCSAQGCTPGLILLKEYRRNLGDVTHRSYQLGRHSWVNKWLQILTALEEGFEYRRCFFLDMIRLSKFEQLELTHTCCRFLNREDRCWTSLDEDEVDEILDEEKELIVILEKGVSDAELCSPSDLEALWSEETNKLMQIQARNFLGVTTTLIE